jgi:hypothetical protein
VLFAATLHGPNTVPQTADTEPRSINVRYELLHRRRHRCRLVVVIMERMNRSDVGAAKFDHVRQQNCRWRVSQASFSTAGNCVKTQQEPKRSKYLRSSARHLLALSIWWSHCSSSFATTHIRRNLGQANNLVLVACHHVGLPPHFMAEEAMRQGEQFTIEHC